MNANYIHSRDINGNLNACIKTQIYYLIQFSRYFTCQLQFFFMTMGVRISLYAPRLIPQSLKVYSRILTLVALRGLELVTDHFSVAI